MHNELVQRERLLEWKKNLETRADNTVTINLRNYTNRNKFYNNRLRIDILRVWIYIILEKIKTGEKHPIDNMRRRITQ